MKTNFFSTADSLDSIFTHFAEFCTSSRGYEFLHKLSSAMNTAKQNIINLSNRVMYALHPSITHSTIHIKHLHNSCQTLDNRSRKVFFLYVKGYSLNEISSISGMKQHTILPTIHKIVNKIPTEQPN